jgi:hypothetical protein
MRHLLLLFLLGVVGLSAQAPTTTPVSPPAPTTPSAWAGFVEAGAASTTQLNEGIGLAAALSPTTQLFVELATLEPGGSPGTTNFFFGVKTDLPKVKSVTPFTIIGYGGSLAALYKLNTLPAGVTGANATSVTALGTALGFAQQYAAGGEYKLADGLVVGVGESINKTTTSAWRPYPFLYVGKSF